MSSDVQLFDAASQRRSPATLPDFHAGKSATRLTRRRSMRSSRSCAWRETSARLRASENRASTVSFTWGEAGLRADPVVGPGRRWRCEA